MRGVSRASQAAALLAIGALAAAAGPRRRGLAGRARRPTAAPGRPSGRPARGGPPRAASPARARHVALAPAAPELPSPRAPGPGPPPEPDPEPVPELPPPSEPRTAPQPPPPPPPQVDEPADPPAGIAIPAAEASTGHDPARRALVAALAAAVPGSAEGADIRRQLGLWSAYLAPDAAADPHGRRATIARAVRANAWWFAARGSPSGVLLRDEDGVILTYRRGQGFAVNPVATTGRWGGLNDDIPAGALAAALMEMGVERVAGDRRFVAWSTTTSPTTPRPSGQGPRRWPRAALPS